MTTGRPLPAPDEQSAPFWAAAAEHSLVVAACAHCRQRVHPPDTVCPHCHRSDTSFAFEPVGGGGTVCSWTVIHQSFLPGFDANIPFVLVDVRLDAADDVRLIGRLLDGPDAPLAIGARVSVAFEDLAPGVAVAAFALEP